MNKDFLKVAYKYFEAEDYFNSFGIEETREFLLEHYTCLDKVYDLLESCGIVDRYYGFKLLGDIKLSSGMGEIIYIEKKNGNLLEVNVKDFIGEVVTMYTKPKNN
jgi:hypothetical protein